MLTSQSPKPQSLKTQSLKIAYQMNDITQINIATDTTFAIMHQSHLRDHEIYYYQPQDLIIRGDTVTAYGHKVLSTQYHQSNYVKLSEKIEIKLSNMNVIWIRQDPPFNMDYLFTTYALDLLQNQHSEIMIINNPSKIRHYPEKIFAHYFSHLMPKTIITKNATIIQQWLKEHKRLVIKPLFEAKGDDVLLLQDQDPTALSTIQCLLDKYKMPIIAQVFLPNISQGDKRVLIIDGQVMGAFNRVPSHGITSNLAKGGTAHRCILSEAEYKVAQTVAHTLKKEGLFFAGIDLIDNQLTEINLTSPTGIKTYEDLTGVDLTVSIWDALEKHLKTNT